MKRFPQGGYMQKLLRVDLSKGDVSEERIRLDLISQYVGGTGLGVRLLYDEVKPGIDPYSSENRLVFVTGPLSGTLVPGSGTYSVVTKNALTGLAVSAQANGFWGARLKYSGYDAIVVQGASEKPVYLHIDNGKVQIEDASPLAGKDTFETDHLLRRKYGEDGFEDKISVAAIGPAGEHRVRFACIVSDRGHVVASGGVGAVMGSKNLKAIVVQGHQGIPIDPSEKESFLQSVRQWRGEAKNTAMGKTVDQYGSLGFFIPYHSRGWVPVKNLTTNVFPGEKFFEGAYLRRKLHRLQARSCHACTFHHCHVVEVKKGRYKGTIGEEPEYEILAGFGPNWGIYDPGAVTMLNDLNDRLGMDAKEATFLISMIMEGVEKGLIRKKEMSGIEPRWGNVRGAAELLRKISRREGFGDLLAEGVMRAAHTLGGEFPDMAIYVKRGNAPHIHDPRTRWGTLFTQAISNTGSQEGVDMTSRGSPELGIDKPTADPDEYLGEVQAKTGPARQFAECLGFCYYQTSSLKTTAETLNCLTGMGYGVEDCLNVGRRVVNLLRMFNRREGMQKEDDCFSPRLGKPPVDGPGKAKSLAPTFERARSAYYRAMGWNEDGVPTRETLEKLDLHFTLPVLG